MSRLTTRQVHGWLDRMRIIPFALLINLLLSGCAEETDQNLRNLSELEKISRLAEVGDPLAQNKLGLSYYRGDKVPQDFNKALEWYGKAAPQEFADAQYKLAFAFGDKYEQSERDGLGMKDGEISETRVLSSEIYKMIVAQRGN